MSVEDVQRRVLQEFGDRTKNRYGWDFRPFLLSPPELRSYDGEMLWTVLVESRSGYHIVFDPSMDEFGIARDGVLISLQESFMSALDAL